MTSENVGLFSVCSVVFITGASRGYGSQLSKTFAQNLAENSLLVLTGRNTEKLDEVCKQIVDLIENKVQVQSFFCDLSDSSSIDAFFGKIHCDLSQFKSAVLINNAGTLGDVSLQVDQYEYSDMKQYIDINVTNTLYFTTKYLKLFSQQTIAHYVINISSLCALKPFPNCGLYCTGKAARDMVFKVLAMERKDIKVLSWAPGPMPTDMMVAMGKAADAGVSSWINEMLENHTYISCKSSADKLILLLRSNQFASGDHIDYYDV